MDLPLSCAARPSASARLMLAQESRASRLQLMRGRWAPELGAMDWRRRAQLRSVATRRTVQLQVDGRTLVEVPWPTGRPRQALDPRGWALWEARLFWALYTANEKREGWVDWAQKQEGLGLGPTL